MPDQKETPTSGAGCLVRAFWMFAGNALLLFILIFIFEKKPTFPSLLDAAYWIAAASLIGLRYVDIRFLKGQTGFGETATMAHWRRYALLVAPLALGAWLIARALVHFLR